MITPPLASTVLHFVGIQTTVCLTLYGKISIRGTGRNYSIQAACRRMRRLEAFFVFSDSELQTYSKSKSKNLKKLLTPYPGPTEWYHSQVYLIWLYGTFKKCGTAVKYCRAKTEDGEREMKTEEGCSCQRGESKDECPCLQLLQPVWCVKFLYISGHMLSTQTRE